MSTLRATGLAQRPGRTTRLGLAKLALAAAACAFAAGAAGWAQPVRFTARADFVLLGAPPVGAQALNDLLLGLGDNSRARHLVDTFDLAGAWHLASAWQARARLARRAKVIAGPAANTFRIEVVDSDPELAAAIANGCIDLLPAALEAFATPAGTRTPAMPPTGPATSRAVEMQAAATVPQQPDDPLLPAWIAGGALAGFGLQGVRLAAQAFFRRRTVPAQAGATLATSARNRRL